MIGLTELTLGMLSHTAGTPTMIEGQKVLNNSFAIPDRGICEGLDGSVTAWHAEEYHYRLQEKRILEGEMMAKENINSANGCDEVGMSDANIEAILKT